MHGRHDSCANWEYEYHPNRASVTKRSRTLEKLFQRKPQKFRRFGSDTRRGHRFLFSQVAPSRCKEIAGNYRGTSGTCLERYEVFVGRVQCYPATSVSIAMDLLRRDCEKLVYAYGAAAGIQSDEARLLRLVTSLCAVLVLFFTIHPYANGNGHTGRMLILLILEQAGFHPVDWRIDPTRNYGKALDLYREGKHTPLIRHMLEAIAGNPHRRAAKA